MHDVYLFSSPSVKGWVTSGRWSMQRGPPSKWRRDLICRFSGEWLKILNLQPWPFPNTFSHMSQSGTCKLYQAKGAPYLFICIYFVLSGPYCKTRRLSRFPEKDWILFFLITLIMHKSQRAILSYCVLKIMSWKFADVIC